MAFPFTRTTTRTTRFLNLFSYLKPCFIIFNFFFFDKTMLFSKNETFVLVGFNFTISSTLFHLTTAGSTLFFNFFKLPESLGFFRSYKTVLLGKTNTFISISWTFAIVPTFIAAATAGASLVKIFAGLFYFFLGHQALFQGESKAFFLMRTLIAVDPAFFFSSTSSRTGKRFLRAHKRHRSKN